MVTGSDIIFFWVARMIMAGYHFMGEAPFAHVYFTSIVRDAQGRKMSKSLGNSPDPLAMMEKYGADSVRFCMVQTPTGQDLLFDEKRLESGKFFANKLWNATKLVTMRLGAPGAAGSEDLSSVKESQLRLSLADRWILSRLANAAKDVTRNLKTYRFAEATQAIYHFAWNEYCDWYLEMAKPRWALAEQETPLTPEQRDDLRTARWVSWRVLDGILRLLHPFMPFVTEELWQAIPHDGDTLALAAWPKAKKSWFDAEAEREVGFLQGIVVAVRNLRVESKIAPGKPVPVVVRGDRAQLDLLERLASQVKPLAKIEELRLSRDGGRPPVAAHAVVQGAEVFLPLEGLVDLDEERARLAREAQKLLADLEGVKKKLRNQDFLRKAKPEIVQKENERLGQLEETLDKLKRAQQSLSAVRE
jgi:valyl-tRNA synthetase